eukprot:TRINITY_DN2056_c0_g1_i1.p1 TRINITY_DN2056_c0_g1~~TRINITY_DN2056_c0_g1_i1.p1  ORF type:complete len:138 (-),score=62.63 TRINITY_DN2056_c0_g1_i1:77-490(-)
MATICNKSGLLNIVLPLASVGLGFVYGSVRSGSLTAHENKIKEEKHAHKAAEEKKLRDELAQKEAVIKAQTLEIAKLKGEPVQKSEVVQAANSLQRIVFDFLALQEDQKKSLTPLVDACGPIVEPFFNDKASGNKKH